MNELDSTEGHHRFAENSDRVYLVVFVLVWLFSIWRVETQREFIQGYIVGLMSSKDQSQFWKWYNNIMLPLLSGEHATWTWALRELTYPGKGVAGTSAFQLRPPLSGIWKLQLLLNSSQSMAVPQRWNSSSGREAVAQDPECRIIWCCS